MVKSQSSGNDNEESKVGKKLSDLTTRRVIILVLVMLCSVPLFSVQTYKAENVYFEYGPELLHTQTDDIYSLSFNMTFETYIEEHKKFA